MKSPFTYHGSVVEFLAAVVSATLKEPGLQRTPL